MERSRSRVTPPTQNPVSVMTRSTVWGSATYTTSAPWGVGTINSSSSSETSEDVVTPNWKSRIAAGEIINNPFTRVLTETIMPDPVPFRRFTSSTKPSGGGVKDIQSYEVTGTVNPGYIYSHGPLLFTDPVLAQLKSDVASEAVTSAFANVDTSEMMALASAAESRKTVDSMVSIMRRITSIARSVRKLDLQKLRQEISPKEFANRYMEMRYAARPLIIDAAQLCNALEVERTHIRKVFRGYASKTISQSDLVSGAYIGASCNVNLNRQATATATCRAGVLTDVEVSALTTFGGDKLAETLWELVPFSFIVDWFTNVGDTIAAWTPNAGIRTRASWSTVQLKEVSTNSPVSGTETTSVAGDLKEVSLGPGIYGQKRTTTVRVPDPQLSVLPSFTLSLDAFKLLDLGIIARGILR